MPAKSKAQFRAMQAAAHGHSTLGIPQKVGKEFAAATESPKNLPARAGKKAKYSHSPDRFEPDAVNSAAPPRIEYHRQPENLNTSESPKKAGQSRGNIQELDGTENRRANYKTKSAAMPEAKAGGSKIPGGVQSYNDTKGERS